MVERDALAKMLQDVARTGDDEPAARRLAEQDPLRAPCRDRAEVERCAEPAGEAALGDATRRAALGDVVRAGQRAVADGVADRQPAPRSTAAMSIGSRPTGSAVAAQLGEL